MSSPQMTMPPLPARRASRGYSGFVTLLVVIAFSFYSTDALSSVDGLEAQDVLLFSAALLAQLTVALLKPHYFRLHDLSFALLFFLSYDSILLVPSIALQAQKHNTEFVLGLCISPILVAASVLFLGARRFPHQHVEQPSINRLRKVLVAAWVICIASVIAYLLIVPEIPLFELQKGVRLELLMEMREDSMKRLPLPLFGYFQLLRYFGFLVLASVSLIYSVSSATPWARISFVLSLILGVFFAALSLAKGPPLLMFFFSGAMNLYLRQKITPGTIILFAFGGFAPVFLAWLLTPENAMAELAGDLFYRRILKLGAEVCYYYYEAFPAGAPRLWGNGITVFNLAFGDGSFRLPTYIYKYMQYGYDETGWANSGYVGSAWPDFGYAGVFGQSLLVGLLAVKLQNYFSKSPSKSMIDLPFVVFVGFFFACLSINSLTGTFFMVSVPAAVFVHYMIRKRQAPKLAQRPMPYGTMPPPFAAPRAGGVPPEWRGQRR